MSTIKSTSKLTARSIKFVNFYHTDEHYTINFMMQCLMNKVTGNKSLILHREITDVKFYMEFVNKCISLNHFDVTISVISAENSFKLFQV